MWQFFIDVGGTFTDVVARRPDGSIVTHKLLSSGAIRGVVEKGSTATTVLDRRRTGEPKDFWRGYRLSLMGKDRSPSGIVKAFDSTAGRLTLDQPLQGPGERKSIGENAAVEPLAYELCSDEPAPVVAIRYLMGLRLDQPIGPIEVRLGTTRATNALLERKGANVAFVTTKGFGDILKIGYQDRPKLFDLHIRKRDELASTVIEIDERLTAAGDVLRPPNEQAVRARLTLAAKEGVDSLAICLLHAHVNPTHEELIARVAEEVGFTHLSVSSRVARLERIVPRGDTTVVDAYLAPVIRDYLDKLKQSLPEARLTLMTSHGGLSSANAVSGKDTILSGPAGGVVGCRHVARRAGFAKTIGFDMGGTSTDVSRIDPPPNDFEYQHETVKAGVRIMTPMINIETVAAGGGSICAFDGQKLTVGPQSAGADPGPACYGRGGPLTVTDMNLILGRLVGEFFPFTLDSSAVETKVAALCEEVNAATGSALTPTTMANGFLRIANANMAAAIKQISTAKGYDLQEYVLTTFGGAGGQHACAIARMLGMRRILCNPFAGVLSAVGIGVADMKRIAQQSVHAPLEELSRSSVERVLATLSEELRESLLGQGVNETDLGDPVRTVDVCYRGQATMITVPADPWKDIAGEFERLHRQLYGYCHQGRAMDIRVARVELAARSAHLETRVGFDAAAQSATRRKTGMVVDGCVRDVPVYLRAELQSGLEISGPAVLIEDTSTIVVDAGWKARVTDGGDVLLSDEQASSLREKIGTKVDPIQLELFNNQFVSMAEQMGVTLRRTALSVNVKERLDYSCAIFTPQGDLVVNAPHIPVHLGGMSDCVKMLEEDVGSFAPGEVYVTNDPYRGGSHLNDVTVVTPVHDESGSRLLFFVASRAHHAEIGGTRPGSMPPDSTSLAQEGVLIRAFRWVRNGEAQHGALRKLLTDGPYPSRTPEENLADIAAQVAANQTGVRELQAMIARCGVETVHAYMRHIQAAAEHKMRAALKRIPDGVHSFRDSLDDGSPITVSINITGERATLDFSGTGPVLKGNLNANRSITTSAVLYCLRCLIAEDIPLNAGVLAPIEIILPECLLNPPKHDDPQDCAAVVGGNVETSQRIVDVIFGALKVMAASQGTMNNLLMGNERFGYYETICGGSGAGDGFHGADAVHTNMTNTRLTDPEVLESRVPVRLVRFAIRRGSGGKGRFSGGCGTIREIEFLEPLEVSILSQRRVTAPYGLHGGQEGQAGRNTLRRAGADEDEVLPSIASVSVARGDRLTIETPGGGGWGKEE